jgi:serine/threonine-protein kinase RsbW
METSAGGQITVRFSSGHGVVSAVVRDVAAFLARDGLPRTMIDDATIALAEALNNIEEHAYGGRHDLPVLVDIRRAEALVRFRVEDRGTPLPHGSLPGDSMPAPDPAAHEKWPEGGFGWGLLHRVTSDLSYHRRGAWNRLCFTIS